MMDSTNTNNAKKIRTETNSNCYLCNNKGYNLYLGLKDSLFNVPGEWTLQKCVNPECGLVWLDPKPVAEDIPKLYDSYYTHTDKKSEPTNKTFSYWFYFVIFKIYKLLYGLLLIFTQIWRKRQEIKLMYLQEISPGKLLEVGCGDGSRLARLKKLGWEIQGQEIDPKAAKKATETYEVPIYLGTLERANFADSQFDAIVINHVIEHVINPIVLLTECHRLLKSGGVLVVTTPNIISYGHQTFSSNWLGLDPPRHLHLFSKKTLEKIAHEAGFNKYETWTTPANAGIFAFGSLDIQQQGYHHLGVFVYGFTHVFRYILASWFQLKASFIYLSQKDSGDECVLKAIKN